ncbi:hypothetical protein JHK82_029871 [Glycine max]|uniref:probable copper-transporting ATPase HMA5 n=1 Tax=Glycine max TaxID=3847 RepID=UPI0003DE7FAF|nr:probable copper-transporting ATPase HMA5 [Glycine max]KAG4993126.1 hypothetical protein JHK86_029953 [Glycine max]KAG5123134.1 hypothetical protein JHK82_029871 [Glycine max]KAG5144548.1 hypothetical protein JHK84_030091 [Glycine max]
MVLIRHCVAALPTWMFSLRWEQSHVNESMITGVGSESALSQIVRLVESAQMAKAPVQKFADRIYKYFVPLVIVISFTTWLAACLVFGWKISCLTQVLDTVFYGQL